MAHRNGSRDTAMSTVAEDEDTVETERPRVVRRGRSATPGLVSLWDENQHLYMENLRLWDCLTLVRGDPTMTCLNAIKLVFGMNDDEYLRMFPDTKQLMLLMFPGGVIYHTSIEEARIENARLKEENARLHAAVWVLRDNPSLQADSTVAAIFRLDETQFLSKFHSDVTTYDVGSANTSNKLQYQNNNKEKKKYFRTSLAMGNEPTMAIHLTNRPIKIGCLGYDKAHTKASKRQRSQSVVHPTFSSRNGSVSIIPHQDFTSNWKPTTPLGHEPTADKIKTSSASHIDSDCAILCWRQNCSFQPVDLYALNGAKSKADGVHSKHSRNCTQECKSGNKSVKIRELRRSNTISRGGNVHAERIRTRPSHAAPIKCVSFAEPVSSYRTDSPLANEFVRDKVKVILYDDCNNPYSALTIEEHSRTHHAAEVCDLTQHGESSTGLTNCNDLTKNSHSSTDLGKDANIYNRSHTSDKDSDVYTVAATREPSKRCQRDTATSPVLDTRTCFLILGQSHHSSSPEHGVISKGDCTASISDDYLLNKSNNNDNNTTAALSPAFSKRDTSTPINKSRYVRPMSPKRRDLRQARKKNLVSFERMNKSDELEHTSNNMVPCSTNNAIAKMLRRDTITLVKGKRGFSISSLRVEPELDDDNEEDVEEEEEEENLQRRSTAIVRNSTDSTPKIYYSYEPALGQMKRHMPYSVEPYRTVKHFLERHDRILQELPCPQGKNEDFARKKLASVTPMTEEKSAVHGKTYPVPHKESAAISGSYLGMKPGMFSKQRESIYIMDYPQVTQKYKEKRSTSNAGEGIRPCLYYNAQEKSKVLKKDPVCGATDKLKELTKLGNFKYSKPLADMIKRNGCYQWKPHKKGVLSTGSPSKKPGSRHKVKPLGPFITFVPKIRTIPLFPNHD